MFELELVQPNQISLLLWISKELFPWSIRYLVWLYLLDIFHFYTYILYLLGTLFRTLAHNSSQKGTENGKCKNTEMKQLKIRKYICWEIEKGKMEK